MTNPILPQVKTASSPEEEIYSKIKEADGWFKVLGNRLLIAIPMTEKIGSIFLSQQSVEENKWQGATGLVLQKGPGAFCDREDYKFYGQDVSVGEWVFFRPSDGLLTEINGQPCRIVRDSSLLGKASGPTLVK